MPLYGNIFNKNGERNLPVLMRRYMYIWGFDLSMACTGIAIFSNDARLILVNSVDTKNGKNHQMKLKLIADKMIELLWREDSIGS
jgi:hypothetical protein